MLPRVSHLQANSIYRKLLYIRQSRHKRALKHRGKLKTHQKAKCYRIKKRFREKSASSKGWNQRGKHSSIAWKS